MFDEVHWSLAKDTQATKKIFLVHLREFSILLQLPISYASSSYESLGVDLFAFRSSYELLILSKKIFTFIIASNFMVTPRF